MADRRTQGLNRREKKMPRWVLAAVIVFSLLFILFAPGRGFFPYRNLKKEVQALDRDNKILHQRNIELAQEIELLKNDKDYLEQLAREKYGLLKKNEEVYNLGKSKSAGK